MVGDTILIKDISINGNDELTGGLNTATSDQLSKTLTDNTINALGIDASSRTIWVNGQPYGNAYVNIKDDTVEAPIGAEIFNDFEHNIASGEYSHAEGSETSAIGDYSHAGGINTVASGKSSFAIGQNNEAFSENSVAVGRNNIVGLKGWYYKAIQFNSTTKVTFLYLSKTQQVPVIVTSASEVQQEKDVDCTLLEKDIVSVVNGSKYDNKYKISANEITTYGRIGLKSVDSNTPFPFNKVNTDEELSNGIFDPEDYSFYCLSTPDAGIDDMGQASFVSGYNNKATNGKATAFGFNNHAYGKFSFVEGRDNEAGYAAHAEGRGTIASGEYSHAEGRTTHANGAVSHAEGVDTHAVGVNSHAEGLRTWSNGENSHSEGVDTDASGNISHAEGYNTRAKGLQSHAEGYNTITGGADDSLRTYSASLETGIFAHAEGNTTTALGACSHSEGRATRALGACSHTEGDVTVAQSFCSHAEGSNTFTQNRSEHAEGNFNVSNKSQDNYGSCGNTQHSVGIGTSKTKRKNAFEIMQNGDTYVLGVGGYDGTNYNTSYDIATYLPNMINITYSVLKGLRDGGKLVPGQQYRITDYTCTTSQAGTTSAGHVFDIIVIADSKNKLNEEARAIQNEGVSYFSGCDLNAWKIWYCLDNDKDRFKWADSTNGKGVIYRMIDEFGNDCPYDFKNIQFYRKWDPSTSSHSIIPSSNETNDFIPCYTFSSEDDPNIGEFTDISLTSSTNVYFNVIKEHIDYHNKQILNNICFFSGNIYNNTFGYDCYNSTIGDDCHYNTFGNNCYNNIFGNSCYNNIFGNECSNNNFDNECSDNTVGNSCSSNKFGGRCNNNTFGISCGNNRFGIECSNNIFSNDCDYNLFSGDCSSNTFGNGCDKNIFGDNCYDNVFDNSCSYNTFGNNCSYNTFGNNCYNIKFASNADDGTSDKYEYYQYNQFGDGCQYILFKEIETSSAEYIQNYKFAQGLRGTTSEYLSIGGKRNRKYETYISKDSNGTVKESVIAELPNMVEIEYLDLVELRKSNGLVPGQQYRITDYTCTTNQTDTNIRSKENVFDIIVTADSESVLNEEARAIKHNGDTYFTNAGANLNAWKIWYCLDNDINRFEWANNKEVDGKPVGRGVIYRMIDEFNNDVPYDFKNIQFKHPNDTTDLNYYYTFASGNTADNADNSLSITNKIYSNKILPYISGSKQSINRILFIGSNCYGNTFGNDCYSNTFGDGCQYNIFGNSCYTNTFESNCQFNTLGNWCRQTTLGDSCRENNMGDECFRITLGTACVSNSFGNKCSNIKFASDSSATTAGSYYQYNYFGDGCASILFTGEGEANSLNQIQKYNFVQGVQPTTSHLLLTVNGKRGREYDTTISTSTDDKKRVYEYCLADIALALNKAKEISQS